jgi:Leucine-rich repeat (LRR) protein
MRTKLYTLTAALLLLFPFTHAQPGPRYVPNLDVMAINSNTILVGTIMDVHQSESAANDVDIHVESWLRGGRQDHITRVSINAPDSTLANWNVHAHLLLIFIDYQAGVRNGILEEQNAIDLSDPNLKVLTADMRVVKDPQQIFQAVHDAINRHPDPIGASIFTRNVPLQTAGLLSPAPNPMGIVTDVPIDSDLERWALSALRESATEQNLRSREDAIQALRYFKKDDNVRLLTSLLKDPTTTILHSAKSNMGVEIRTYPLREGAYQVLKDWGLEIPKPVTLEEIQKPESVTLINISNKADFVHHADLDVLSRFPNLQTILLNNDHRMTDQAFRSLGLLKTLRSVSLADSNVNDDRLKYLTGLSNLESLDLRGTKITDDGLKTISNLTTLKKLNLAQTQVTRDGIVELQRLRPDLLIVIK